MYGIFTYIYRKFEPKVGKYTIIHASYGSVGFRGRRYIIDDLMPGILCFDLLGDSNFEQTKTLTLPTTSVSGSAKLSVTGTMMYSDD